MQPYDYASILQAGQNLVPNSTVRDAQLAQMRAQTAQVQQQVQANQKAQSDQQAFQNDLDGYLTNPTPQATSALLLKHPSFAKQIKDSYDVTDAESRRNNMTQKVSIYSAARGGNYGLAAKILEARINSDKVSGQDVSHDEAILTALKGGTETERKAAVGMLQLDIAGADPERFGATYGALTKADEPNLRTANPGDVIFDERTLKKVFESPYKPQLVQVRNADGSTSVIEYTSGGGDQSSTPPSPTIPATGGVIESAIKAIIPNVGVTSRKRDPAKNDAVGGVKNSYHLTDQARDFVPPRGMQIGQLFAQVKQALPDFDVINEGDHVHVEPKSRSQGVSAAQLRIDAEAAIAKGAPRAAVEARLNELLKGAK
jgi:Peptidase M15